MAWTYSDYITYDDGADRLTQLRLHIQEVVDRLEDWQSQNLASMSGSRYQLQGYLERLLSAENSLASALGVDALAASIVPFVKVRPIPEDAAISEEPLR